MSKVFTTKGLIEAELLEVKDIITFSKNSRDTATEWYLDGELVRRDVNINILQSLSITGEQSNI